MAKAKVLSVANQKGGVGKSTTVYNLGAGLAMSGKKALALDVDPQGDLTKMLGQRRPHELSLTLAKSMNDVVSGAMARDHPEIMHHQEGFYFVPGNRSLSAEGQRLAQDFVPQRKLADVGQCFAQLIPFAIICTKEMMSMPKRYPEEFKKQVIAIYVTGAPLATISKKYHISLNTLYRWRKEYRQAEDQATTKDYPTLYRQYKRQDHILQIIRLSNIIDDVPRRKRLEILARLHEQFEQYSVHELCEALNISRGTFYNHIFRRADRTEYLQKQQELMMQIQQIFDDSQQRFGAEKIRVILAENGICVGKKRIRQIMQELGLTSIRENAKSNYRNRQEYLKRNLVNQEFSVTCPNEIWASDITYFKIKGYAVYLCVIIDLFSRMVVGYRVSRKCSTHLVTATFKNAFRARGKPTELTFHSDRGGQYTSDTFFKLLRQCGVKQSFSRSGRPCDNAVAETFFASFKREEAYRRDYSSEADFRKSVDEYVQFYNEQRPHQTLAYKSPIRFEELYGQKKAQVL